ncbi:hypothetical protein Tco_1337183 [Tanacetum coccineum]
MLVVVNCGRYSPWETISEIEHAFKDNQYQPEGILELFRKLHDNVQNIHAELAEYINTPSWNRPTIYYDNNDDDDEDYTIAITPDLPITDSLIMEDEHLDTIPATESDELIKCSVENLVQIPSESEEASPPDSELVSLEVVEIVIPEIEALKDNPTPSSDFVTKSSSTSLNFFLEETNTFDNSLPESETFCFNLEEISSGSPTSYLDLSLPDSEAFFCYSEPDSGKFHYGCVFDTFASIFHHKNEDNVVKSWLFLASNEEKSPHLLSHRGFKAFQLISESLMMISRGDIPILDVPFLHFYAT